MALDNEQLLPTLGRGAGVSLGRIGIHRAPSAEFDYSDERASGQIHNIVKEFGFIRGDKPVDVSALPDFSADPPPKAK